MINVDYVTLPKNNWMINVDYVTLW